MKVLSCMALLLLTACERSGDQHGPARDPLPRLVVPRTALPPTIDGALSDAAWAHAATTGPLAKTRDSGPAAVIASAKALWDERNLYLAVQVHDDLLIASDLEHDAHLWTKDCVELMISPGESNEGYFEIEVSPRGVVFDSRFDSRRAPAPFGNVHWDSRARVAARLRGEIDDERPDRGYTIELAIPWQAFSPSGVDGHPPAAGAEWRANLYVLDVGLRGRRAAAWSAPGVDDFHVPSRFGRLAFEGPEALESPEAAH